MPSGASHTYDSGRLLTWNLSFIIAPCVWPLPEHVDQERHATWRFLYVRARPPAETRSALVQRIENNWAIVRPPPAGVTPGAMVNRVALNLLKSGMELHR